MSWADFGCPRGTDNHYFERWWEVTTSLKIFFPFVKVSDREGWFSPGNTCFCFLSKQIAIMNLKLPVYFMIIISFQSSKIPCQNHIFIGFWLKFEKLAYFQQKSIKSSFVCFFFFCDSDVIQMSLWYQIKGYRGFSCDVISSQFATHHTRDRHVGFLLAWHGIGKHNKMSHYFLFSSYHNTKL